jgi:hypothetical protein
VRQSIISNAALPEAIADLKPKAEHATHNTCCLASHCLVLSCVWIHGSLVKTRYEVKDCNKNNNNNNT